MKKIDKNKLVGYAGAGIIIVNFLVYKGIVILDKINPSVVCEFTKESSKEDELLIVEGEEFSYNFEETNDENLKRTRSLK